MTDTAAFNSAIISKLSWMSRKLRHIDDLQELIPWVNTMHSIKQLLFPQPSCYSTKTNFHKTSPHSTSRTSSYSHIKNNPEHSPHLPEINTAGHKQIRKPSKSAVEQSRFDITRRDDQEKLPPGLLQQPLEWTKSSSKRRSFLGTNTMELSQLSETATSPSTPLQKSNPLTRPKPPFHRTSVPILQRSKFFQHNFASTTSTPKMSPVPGIHIWEGTSPLDHKQNSWSFHKRDGAVEYKILKETADTTYNFIVQDLRTGEKFEMHLSEDNWVKSKN